MNLLAGSLSLGLFSDFWQIISRFSFCARKFDFSCPIRDVVRADNTPISIFFIYLCPTLAYRLEKRYTACLPVDVDSGWLANLYIFVKRGEPNKGSAKIRSSLDEKTEMLALSDTRVQYSKIVSFNGQ